VKYNLSDPISAYINPFPVVTVNGSEHILSPLNSLIKGPGFKVNKINQLKIFFL